MNVGINKQVTAPDSVVTKSRCMVRFLLIRPSLFYYYLQLFSQMRLSFLRQTSSLLRFSSARRIGRIQETLIVPTCILHFKFLEAVYTYPSFTCNNVNVK